MSLHITAELSEGDLKRLLAEILPATIDLDPLGADTGKRWIHLDAPHHVDFVAREGVRVRTSAQLQWTALGLKVPVTMHEVHLLVAPVIAQDDRGPKLVFRPTLEKADFKHMPEFVDQAIANRINMSLAAQGELLGWHVGETLQHTVPLPPNLTPVSAFLLNAGAVSVEVTDQCFVLRIEVELQFARMRKDAAQPLG